ncbi:MAG: hypothetical protein D084_Lepto4C00325G0003 [Leptospirillum sp. Group IV 'UBA BS']|nr:MAG: hypothetical protein D084_Lepto4C00325G0003 [Leptospirillum sp. Group IV 'UBA BS']
MTPSPTGGPSEKKEFLQTLRSPREKLGGYVVLPRLIDKVRLRASGRLPPDYLANLLRRTDPAAGFYPARRTVS